MKLEKVAVIGAGTMGSGIAQWFATQDVSIELIDMNEKVLDSAKARIHASWEMLQAKGKITKEQVASFKGLIQTKILSEINPTTDLVIEAIIENLEVKKELFKQVDLLVGEQTVIASNTSSFPIKMLSVDLSEQRKANFLGLHFFNPAPIMKLVEIISSMDTNPELAQNLYQWFLTAQKKPALCTDSPGFIVNRVARNFYGEALRIAKVDDQKRYQEIDQIMREVAGFKMGPFELMDLIGIDINLDVTESVWNAFDQHPRYAPHELQRLMVGEKRLGKKTKIGFYQYE
jgi:3-hydroxybutyryl-CoA dehydrogenase